MNFIPPQDETITTTVETGDEITPQPPFNPKKVPALLLELWNIFPRNDLIMYLEEANQMGNTALHYAVKNGQH